MSDVATRAPRPAARATLRGRLLDIGQRPGDDPDLRVRKRTAVAVVYALVVAGLFYVVVAIIVVGMTTIASGVVTLGGMQESNGNIIFAIITPIGAVLLLGRRAAI